MEYRGEIVDLTNSLLQLPAGGQVLLSDTTFQRIGGRLHEVKLPAFHFQKPAEGPRNSIDGPRNSIEGQSRKDLDGQMKLKFDGLSKHNLDGQIRGTEGQDSEAGSNPPSQRSSIDSTSRHAVRSYARTPSVPAERPRNSIDRPRNSIVGPRNSIEGQSRTDLDGQIKLKFEGQSTRPLDGQVKRTEGQGSEAGSNPSSRPSSIDSTSQLAVRLYARATSGHGISACTL